MKDGSINQKFLIVAIVSCVFLLFLAYYVGNYLRVGVQFPLYFKVIHVAAGFVLAMLFRSFCYSWTRVCIAVFSVSIVYEVSEHIMVIPSAGQLIRSGVSWFHLPTPTIAESMLDFVWNYSGVLLFHLWYTPKRKPNA